MITTENTAVTANSETATPANAYGHPDAPHSILRIEGTYHSLAISNTPEGEDARAVQDGPMVPGPWATTFGLGACIHNGSVEQKERERDERAARTIIVKTGDLLEVTGVVYRVEVYRREYIRLNRVNGDLTHTDSLNNVMSYQKDASFSSGHVTVGIDTRREIPPHQRKVTIRLPKNMLTTLSESEARDLATLLKSAIGASNRLDADGSRR